MLAFGNLVVEQCGSPNWSKHESRNLKMTVHRYPFSDPSVAPRPHAGLLRHLWMRYETWRVLRKQVLEDVEINLLASPGLRPLTATDIPLLFLCRNDLKLLPAFFNHYRGVGVTRFIVVDDQSSDGSREWLSSQADADVWISPLRYGEARRGRLWREKLLRLYGGGRWYLNVDVDEFLVYDQCGSRDLRALITALEARGARKMAAPMLDLYPGKPLESAEFNSALGDMPWTVANCFDRTGYDLTFKKRYMSLRGGPRRRMFGAEAELMKYPLLHWGSQSSLGTSIHQPLPYGGNFCSITGVLLHFKFFSDVETRVTEAVADGQYFDGAAEYKKILNKVEKGGGLDFRSPSTTVYEGPQQLVEMGFIERLFNSN